jgi:prepilin-type N-terminal cleavage/methylation domain-containing protein
MKTKFDAKGVTLIELLVALVISGIIVAAIYRLFVAQTRSYTVQDQVAEVQQNVRNAVELLVRDIRMAGFDDDKPVMIGGIPVDLRPGPAITNPMPNAITVSYEHNGAIRQVTYSVIANNLYRTGDALPLLENVDAFTLTYFIDAIDPLTGNRDRRSHFEVQAGAIPAAANVVAVRVRLSARPASNNPDVNSQVSPRRLDTVVTIRSQLSNPRI